MTKVESVWFNDGTDEDVFALVVGDGEGDTKNLISFDPSTAAPEHRNNVPRREKIDYGPEGGGDTYHLEA